MDIEFHYYITYLAALKAGFSILDAYKIAYSAQYVDDNPYPVFIKNHPRTIYKNCLTQVTNPFINKIDINKMMICFHFIPGDYNSTVTNRIDKMSHPLSTTPNSRFARSVMESAMKTQNPYFIGIASHAFTDTWAHQNFTGTYDVFNAALGFFNFFIPDIGHADYLLQPDRVNCNWKDKRLINPGISNNERFLDAAAKLLEFYYGSINQYKKTSIIKEFQNELAFIFNKRSLQSRLTDYNRLALKYSKHRIIPYNPIKWFKSAVNDTSNWIDDENYFNNDWYLFQESAKSYFHYTLKLLESRIKPFLN